MTVSLPRVALALAILTGLAGGAAATAPTVSPTTTGRPFGLVIGCNDGAAADRPPLRFADDDAVQYARLLEELGAAGRVVLLTRLDAETAALHPALAPTPPTRAAVRRAAALLNEKMDAARAAGERPVLYVVYTGHGDVVHGEGRVVLEDGPFDRDDLLDLLRGSRATTNHVVIDACRSYFLVFERGPGGDRRPRTGPLVAPADGDGLPPGTGVFLSTSAAQDSHEWEAFQAGVFSHELRSALRGGADADGDGRVTYEEAAAFVWTANATIPSARFRPSFVARPPAGHAPGEAVLVDLAAAPGERLTLPPSAGRVHVEDARGVRLADVHLEDGATAALLVPADRPLFVRRPADGVEYVVRTPTPPALAQVRPRPAATRARGAEHEAFRRLFARPFGAAAVAAFRARPAIAAAAYERPTDLTWVRHGVGITAALVGAVGGTMTALAVRERDRVDDDTSGAARADANDRIRRYNHAAIACYAVAGAAFTAWVVWTAWPEDEPDVRVLPVGGRDGVGVVLATEF